MRRSRPGLPAVLLAGLIGLAALPARAVPYLIRDLGVLGSENGYDRSYATGLNASGQVVGYADKQGLFGESQTNEYRAFVTGPNGVGMRDLGTLGGTWSRGFGIHDAGQVVGSAGTADGSAHAFLGGPGGGALADLGTLDGTSSSARAINRHGQVAGTASNALGHDRAFITDPGGGHMRDLGTLGGGLRSEATGIGDNGRVVGATQVRAGEPPNDWYPRAFISDANGGPLREIRVSGQDNADPVHWSRAAAINSRGDVAGTFDNNYDNSERPFHAPAGALTANPLDVSTLPHIDPPPNPRFPFSVKAQAMNSPGQVVGQHFNGPVYSGFVSDADGTHLGDIRDLAFVNPEDMPGSYLWGVTGINDAGQILVNTVDNHAFLLTPVPEPATVLLLAGMGWMGAAAGRRRAVRNDALARGQRCR